MKALLFVLALVFGSAAHAGEITFSYGTFTVPDLSCATILAEIQKNYSTANFVADHCNVDPWVATTSGPYQAMFFWKVANQSWGEYQPLSFSGTFLPYAGYVAPPDPPASAASSPSGTAATSDDVATLVLALCVTAVMFSGFIGFRIGYSQ